VTRHFTELVRALLVEEGPLDSDAIAELLAERGDAVAVIDPESVETYERDGGEVTLVRGGSLRAVSPRAVDGRLGKWRSGFRRTRSGEWELEDDQ